MPPEPSKDPELDPVKSNNKPNEEEPEENQSEGEADAAAAAGNSEPIEPENYRNRKIEEGVTNLLKRGKT